MKFGRRMPHNGDARSDDGSRQTWEGDSGTLQGTIQPSTCRQLGEREADASRDLPEADCTAKTRMVASIKKTENLVRFGTVGVFDGPEVIDPQGLGA